MPSASYARAMISSYRSVNRAERGGLSPGLSVIIPSGITPAAGLRAGLFPPAALRLGPGVFGVRHPLPRGLGLLDVPPGRLALLLGCHDPPPVRVTFPWGTAPGFGRGRGQFRKVLPSALM